MRLAHKNIICLVLAILFLGCLFKMPYFYYTIVRVFGFVGFGILAYKEIGRNGVWLFFWSSSAVLTNPFVKISLSSRFAWNVVDVLWAIMLLIYVLLGMKLGRKN